MVRLNILKATEEVGLATTTEDSDVQSGGKYDFILSDATLTTQTEMSTNPTFFFYAGESENDYDNTVEARTHSIVAVEPVEGSISTVAAQISELDTVGFD
jgi:hypothetical protein